MYTLLRKWARYFVTIAPLPLTKNERYDRLTEQIIKRVCDADSICIDVGANEGKILAMFIRHCPGAIHFAFEPIPLLYKLLVRKFGSACRVYQVALSDCKGRAKFNVAQADLAYSGLKKRSDKHFNDVTIEIESDLLDNIIPACEQITLIKIDVEGGEYNVLSGAKSILHQHKPFVLFEFGQGGSDAYSITPQLMFMFFEDRGYQVYLLQKYLAEGPELTAYDFEMHYKNRTEYFFIASPASPIKGDITT